MRNEYRPGDWNAMCFRCGRKRKASEMKKQWQGYWVCPEHWEPRHPQDYVKAAPKEEPPEWTQPKQNDVYLLQCTAEGVSAIPGLATPGCSIPAEADTIGQFNITVQERLYAEHDVSELPASRNFR